MKFVRATPDRKGELVRLIERLHHLNGEYDNLLRPSEELNDMLNRSLDRGLSDERSLLILALDNERVVGVIAAMIIDRELFEPRMVGKIGDIYVLPEYRRLGAGYGLVEEAEKELKARGAQMIFAEFPLQNSLAASFYESLGFRPLTGIYAKETGRMERKQAAGR